MSPLASSAAPIGRRFPLRNQTGVIATQKEPLWLSHFSIYTCKTATDRRSQRNSQRNPAGTFEGRCGDLFFEARICAFKGPPRPLRTG